MIRIIVRHSLTKLNNKRYKQQQFLLSMIGKFPYLDIIKKYWFDLITNFKIKRSLEKLL